MQFKVCIPMLFAHTNRGVCVKFCCAKKAEYDNKLSRIDSNQELFSFLRQISPHIML